MWVALALRLPCGLPRGLSCNPRSVATGSFDMWVQVACEALRSGHVLELRYDGYSRSVEVHAVGFTKEDNAAMRVWQVSGGNASNKPVGREVLPLGNTTCGIGP